MYSWYSYNPKIVWKWRDSGGENNGWGGGAVLWCVFVHFTFLHGFFNASIKLPADYTAGVVVAFYVSFIFWKLFWNRFYFYFYIFSDYFYAILNKCNEYNLNESMYNNTLDSYFNLQLLQKKYLKQKISVILFILYSNIRLRYKITKNRLRIVLIKYY